jgi:RHS repeat-associated protein
VQNTEQRSSDGSQQAAAGAFGDLLPSVSLPKGGGAIKGIGEKFGVNPVNGTGSFTIPVFTSPGRAGFYPKLSLAYDSGSGNGPLGFGWSLSVPSITRKTDKGLPRYQDADESDVFILSEAEDLVPKLLQTSNGWLRETFSATRNGVSYTIRRYRPRVEGLFARIERWQSQTTQETFWKTVSKDNITSLFGLSSSSQIADPDDSTRVFKWLLEQSYDDKGNLIVYEYKPENRDNVSPSIAESSHDPRANRYLKRVYYGTAVPYYPDDTAPAPVPLPNNWFFQVVFDYGEHDAAVPRPAEDYPWPARQDPFSSYRSTFEVRTYRLCRRVLMFHQFAELGTAPCLVRSTNLAYKEGPLASYLVSVQSFGYIRNQADQSYSITDPQTGEILSPKAMPPVAMTYTEATVDQTVQYAYPAALENLPYGVDGGHFQWVDLDSEGSPGVLAEYAGSWLYKRNASNVPRDDNGNIVPDDGGSVRAYFEPVEEVATLPSLAQPIGGRQHFMDLDGEGRQFLVQFSRPVPGYYKRNDAEQWQAFVPFEFCPNVDWGDPNLRTIDLDGDGFPDILITEDDALVWYPSFAEAGFGQAQAVPKPFDEDHGPAIVFADTSESIFLADFSGDGLTDIVRIRAAECSYFPNLGFGRFGAKITLDNSPNFDSPDQFDPKRLRLADIDGSGTTDIIYLGRDVITLYFNQSGNSFSTERLTQFPPVDNLESVTALDLLGNGTACLVWSSPLPGDSSRPMKYIDLMGGQKPHLLVSVVNNLGAETKVQYAASTKFYLLDRAAGTPWITRLAFPVHVAERVETFDYVSHHKFVSLYKYHQGYYDGVERELRGFGMVEQLDTESFSKYSGGGLFTEPPETAGDDFYLPAVLTKTWFHTGAYFGEENISRHFQEEYYQGDSAAVLLPDSVLPEGLTADEIREACRALKGRILREEVFALDGAANSADPYTVTEHNYQVRLEQPMANNLHAVFYTGDSESLAYHYERNPADPRIGHQLTIEIDEFGNVVKAAAVGYPRRLSASLEPEQEKILITYTENDVINRPDELTGYRIGLPAETRNYELTGLPLAANTVFYSPDQVLAGALGAAEIPYDATPTNGVTQKRLIARVRTLYRTNDLSRSLPVGQIESLALPYETYKMAFTPGLLNIYSAKVSLATLTQTLSTDGEYQNLDNDGSWWVPSGHVFYSDDPANPDPAFAKANFYLPQGAVDPFGNISNITYDQPYNLLIAQSEDALHNLVRAQNDYRVLQPSLITDPNLNRSAVRFDALGMVIATAVMGKVGANEGDTLDDPTTKLEYDLYNWLQESQPNFVHMFAREMHGAANPRWQESYSYSDGLGREVMRKVQAEPGLAPVRDANGKLVRDAQGNLVPPQFTQSRWVGTGRTVFDNKGNPVKKYEPFFDSTPAYEDEADLVELGVTPILRYDPLGRVIRTDNPDGSYSQVIFDPWQQITSDENDTVLDSVWYAKRGSPLPSAPEPSDPDVRAAWLTAKHANTPTTATFDTLGRTFLAAADNGPDSAPRFYQTRIDLDIQGNQRSVTDARNRLVMTYDYDVLRNRIHQFSVDAGERWILDDVAGKPIQGWDSRNNTLTHEYDALRRPTNLFVQTGNAAKILAERTLYGENQPSDQEFNLRGKVFQQFDGAGVLTNNQYDFKGNLLGSIRQLLQKYSDQVDWSQAPLLESETFTSSTAYDALNRPIQLVAPTSNAANATFNVIQPTYSPANLLEKLDGWLQQSNPPQGLLDSSTANFHPVTNLDYNAKGQRELIEYGNGAQTAYQYDPDTFRLVRLRTTRPQGLNGLASQLFQNPGVVQDLNYNYDPVGNITTNRDNSLPTLFYNNEQIDPVFNYSYDPIYRLLSAKGREHIGQTTFAPSPPPENLRDYPFLGLAASPNDLQAMRNYTESYAYDQVGNIQAATHVAANGNWTRIYAYDEPNRSPTNNRLTSTTIGTLKDTYTYDAHGNMTQMPPLPVMQWDFKDQLNVTQQQVVNSGGGERTYYVYDAAGQRVRKVTENKTGTKTKERIYLGGFEVYREYHTTNGATTLERDSLHVMDDKRRAAIVETTIAPGASPVPVTRYQFDNHLGSASLELDDGAKIISYEDYYPYGSTSYQAVNSAIEVSLKRYRYTGKERDEESGLYYHGARYYAPWLGRWISCDPKGLLDGINMFIYGRNNPIGYVDPTGTQCDPTMQSCINPTAPTSREEAALQSLPEGERHLSAQVDRTAATESGRESLEERMAGWSEDYTKALKGTSGQARQKVHDYYNQQLHLLTHEAIHQGNIATLKFAGAAYAAGTAGAVGGLVGTEVGLGMAAELGAGTVGTNLLAHGVGGVTGAAFSEATNLAYGDLVYGKKYEVSGGALVLGGALGLAGGLVATGAHYTSFPVNSTDLRGMPGAADLFNVPTGKYGWQFVITDEGGLIGPPIGSKQDPDIPSVSGLHRAHYHGYFIGGSNRTFYSSPRINTSYMKIFENAASEWAQGGFLQATTMRGGGVTSLEWSAYTAGGQPMRLGVPNVLEQNLPTLRPLLQSQNMSVTPGATLWIQ